MFTCSKHVIVGFPRWLIKINTSLHQLSDAVVLSHSSGTLSSLEFHFPKWLHIHETCDGMLMTTFWHTFHEDLLFWSPHLGENKTKRSVWAVVKFTVRRNLLTKNSHFLKGIMQCEEHKAFVDICHSGLHLPLPGAYSKNTNVFHWFPNTRAC